MDDTARFGKLMVDQLEWRDGGADQGRAAWDAQAWYGGDLDKLWLKTEGRDISGGPDRGVSDASVELLWDRVIARWWNLQLGGREDFGPGQSRTWAAAAIEGIAPQWVEAEATVYVGEQGRTAGRLKAQYDLLLTQRLILQPYVETNLYSRSDPRQQVGAGLSDLELSFRLRFEIRRELAPYVGLVWLRRFGGTAELARAAGAQADDLELAAGLRVWF
jgi:copper resistance protein B